MNRPVITRAKGDLLYDSEGRTYVDLFTGHGAVLLGHSDAAVVGPLVAQLQSVWTTAGLENPGLGELRAKLAPLLGAGLELKLLYSTGMEAAEFALRFARISTGRPNAVGFDGNMHGKSFATARLGWPDLDGSGPSPFVRLPYLGSLGEAAVLDGVSQRLDSGDVGCVFLEPIQGSAAGRTASPAFQRSLEAICHQNSALLVFDEILTGLHRTGPAFVYRESGVIPDVVLMGKALGNGFPISGVALRPDAEIESKMLAGSTYAGNPLASAAALATLCRMEEIGVAQRVEAVGRVLADRFARLKSLGVELCGRGALWILSMPDEIDLLAAVIRIHARGVAVGHAGRQLRVLPAATIDLGRLEKACDVVCEELESEFAGIPSRVETRRDE